MKKLILSTLFCIAGTVAATAQCTPGANFADSTFGVWPDTVQNFPMATQNVAYSTDLNFKVPSDAGDIDPLYTGATIVSFVVNSVVGLPPGMSHTCNISNCSYLGGANGCAQITGTCATPGTYNITINLTAALSTILGTINVPQAFTGYKIIVGSLGQITIDASNIEIFPNPVSDDMTIRGLEEYNVETANILNTAGQIIRTLSVEDLNQLELNVSNLNAGIYMLQLNSENGTFVKRFIKQ